MPTTMLCLPLVWLLATAAATVTLVPTPETSPRAPKLLRESPLPPVPPRPVPAPWGDEGAPVLPRREHPELLPALAAAPEATDPASPAAPEGAPLEPGTTASGSTAAPAPGSTSDSPGPSAQPCPGDEEPAEDCGRPTEEQREAVSEAVATFALRFYQRMAEAARPEDNLLFSPVAVAMGLSHLLLGARGETRERLAAVLAYPPGLGCVHSALRLLSTAPGLFSATQIFHHPDLRLRTRFLNESLHFYNTRPWALSGNESLDLQRINAWVREASRGLLPELLSTLPPDYRLVLLSAVHLQAAWLTPLDVKQTVPLPFLRPGRPPRLVPTMTSKKYPVASFVDPHLQVQVGRLALRGGLSLALLLPLGPPGALGALERALDPPALLRLLRRAARAPPRAAALALPRVRLDVALDVVPLVHDMDFGLFLDAELCGLARGAAVDTARHRAVLALDEAGVEAAGAMAASVARSAPLLEALRPFLFLLWHDSADVPVFMGRLSDPAP
ncbi:plasma protease C1 inhibitor [Lathamus discolor]|uniref:plasma protease C1 inhibitor n=1 Tax=Lathamus discolor TaxID=678569 RepID=UPI0032B873FE